MRLGDTKETTVDVRFIFATNKELKNEIEDGKFRKDLFFRINAFVINLPPLREKREDIPLLANYFLQKFARRGKKKRFSKEAMELLTAYGWPGNVRELANIIERSVLLSAYEEITVDDFPEGMLDVAPQAREQETLKLREITVSKLDQLGKEHIERVLNSVGGNKAKAARLLGITRKTLYSKISKEFR